MGLLFSRGSQDDSESRLGALETKIEYYKEQSTKCRELERKFATLILKAGTFLYLGILLLYYFNYRNSPNRFFIILWVVTPIPFIYGLKRLLGWYFKSAEEKNLNNMKKLQEEQESVLEQLKETGSYKKVAEILQKYGKAEARIETEGKKEVDVKKEEKLSSTSSGLRQRKVDGEQTQATAGTSGEPVQPIPQVPKLIRPILPRERSVGDRFMDWIIGDGVENRFALICSQCSGHNGMALREEFPYLPFRCCFCGFLNPPKVALGDTNELPADESIANVLSSTHAHDE